MKKSGFSVKAIGLFLICMLFGACDSIEGIPPIFDPTDSLYGLGEVVSALVKRVGEVGVDENQQLVNAAKDFDATIIADYQYAYDTINKWYGLSLDPKAGTEPHKVNMKSLLTMMDTLNQNQNRTNYGGSLYATDQVVDKEAVDIIVKRLWQPSRLFVALAGGNVIAYSTDAGVWLTGSSSSSPEYRDIVYGAGKFVVVENNLGKSSSIYSFDGHNWFVSPDSSVRISALAYGNGRFVGVNDGYTGYVSSDGVSWQSVSMAKDGGHSSFSSLTDIAYGADTFIAIQSGGDKLAVTPDGADWKWEGVLPSADWSSINYEGGKFVVLGKGGKIAVSTDGVEWEEVIPDDTLDLADLAYGAGKFIALSSSGKAITSTDGLEWTDSAALKDGEENVRGWDSITYGAGKFVAVAGHYVAEGETVQSGRIAVSTDGGVSWEISNPLGNRDCSHIIFVDSIKGMDG